MSHFAQFTSAPEIWHVLTADELKNQTGLKREQFTRVFADATLQCEAMLSDVNRDGKLDVVLKKRHLFDAKEQSSDETVCAYYVENGKVFFLDYG